MLTRRRRGLAAALLTLAGTCVSAAPAAHAEGDVSCVGVDALTNNCSAGTVVVTVTVGGQAVTTELSNVVGSTPVCQAAGVDGRLEEIPCTTSAGWWSSSRGCYVRASDPQPPLSDPVWQGHTDGVIYLCSVNPAGAPTTFWSADPPDGAPSVTQLAAQIVESLDLKAVGVGMAPTPTSVDPSSIGIVGFPNWLWVKTPSATTWGPAEGSRSSGAVTVDVTAKVQKVTWTMGDGSAPIVCTSPGTPYDASYGRASSPTCGYAGYQKQGTYTVSAVSHWVITYTSNVGVSGTMTMDLTASAAVTIGELQTTVN